MGRVIAIALVCALVVGLAPAGPQGFGVQMTGTGAPNDATCTSNRVGWGYIDTNNGRAYVCKPSGAWTPLALQSETGGAGLPSGAIYFKTSGECGGGASEATDLAGLFLEMTTVAAGDVGGTGGSDTLTPAGTNSAPAFTGTQTTTIVNHTHALATGTGATGNFSQVIGTVDASSGGTGGAATQAALATVTGNPTSGGAANYTPAGTVAAPTFTGSSAENRPAFMKVIPCRVN
jgi:hypothetical protein